MTKPRSQQLIELLPTNNGRALANSMALLLKSRRLEDRIELSVNDLATEKIALATTRLCPPLGIAESPGVRHVGRSGDPIERDKGLCLGLSSVISHPE